ncbi:MAG: hypothetical protein IPG81_27585 [Sandaracinaceae bacterium]|nr:hypothetical protein [Sandaracinaceae bacterium]
MGTCSRPTSVDGWGRPFVLSPTTRAALHAAQPVAGYELSSAGPDGRAGNGDDLVDSDRARAAVGRPLRAGRG